MNFTAIPVVESKIPARGRKFDSVDIYWTPDTIYVVGWFGYARWRAIRLAVAKANTHV